MSKIYYLMGKSSSGKDTIYSNLVNNSSLNLKTVVIYTTRPIREHEKNGREYFFVDEEKLKEFESSGKIIEKRAYDTVHGVWHYFTVDDGQIELDNGNYIMIGTLESYAKVRKYYGKDNVIPIYIDVEDGIRIERALNREREQANPKYAEMCRRFLADTEDFCQQNIEANGIIKKYNNNGSIEECISEITQDIMPL